MNGPMVSGVDQVRRPKFLAAFMGVSSGQMVRDAVRVLGILWDRRPRMTELADYLGLEKQTMSIWSERRSYKTCHRYTAEMATALRPKRRRKKGSGKEG